MSKLSKLLFLSALLLGLSGCSTLKVVNNLDPKAGEVYSDLFDKFIESGGDIGAATVWRMKVKEGVYPEDIPDSLMSAAMGTGLLKVGELPLSDEIAARSGRDDVRYLRIYEFCNPMTADIMVDYSPYFSAYLPCRISVVEEEDGLYLYSLNMDMMVYGARELPPELKEKALVVRNTVWNMMEQAASGAF